MERSQQPIAVLALAFGPLLFAARAAIERAAK
jgi:hypothetical protein